MRRILGLRRQHLLSLVALALVLSFTADWSVNALPRFRGPSVLIDPATGTFLDCPDFLKPTVELVRYTSLVGYPIVGFTVKISGEAVKFHGQPNAACGFPAYVAPLPEYEWWLEEQPVDSTAQLFDEATLSPRLRLDKAGTYVVRLVVCPDGCEIQPPGGHLAPIPVAPGEFIDVTIQALESAPLGPETTPAVVPSSSVGFSTPPGGQCSSLAGLFAKQWWAVRQIETPDDYRVLEGSVVHSRVSRKDAPWNHRSQDANFHIKPDLKYSDIQFESDDPGDPGPNDPRPIEVEWERNSIPERYRPTPGDRASIFGYWVTDCGHGRPEIHPPVGIAVHRPRPIRVPDTETFTELGGAIAGRGIYVPGVITDMFFGKDGGALIDCGLTAGLANAERVPVPGQPGPGAPDCVPPPSLNGVFQFDIFLPRNPQVTMRQAGFTTVPPVPLYIQRDAITPGPEPDIDIKTDPSGILTYLHVTLDLRGYTGSTYAYRIAAGWVLPSADNWGLARFKLGLNRLNVADADPGNWRLWVNTNNATNESFATQEWVQIINYGVRNLEDFGGRPWETGLPGEPGAPPADRSLGPDLLRYPHQYAQPIPGPRDYGILFHTTGYEDHPVVDDDAGTVLRSRLEPGTPYTLPNDCTPSEQAGGLAYSGCEHYTAEVNVVPGPALPPAILSPEAQRLADQYVLRCQGPLCKGGDLDAIVAAPLEAFPVDPLDAPLAVGAEAREFAAFEPFEPAERETTSLTDITIADFYRDVLAARRTDPALLGRALGELHAVFIARIKDRSTAREAILDAQVLRASLPPDLWARYFSDLPSPRPEPGGSKALFTGAGTVEVPRGRVSLRSTVLHCDALRRPNSLSVTWERNRFDLDLVLWSECTDRRGGGIHVQEGAGIGRLNGVPGSPVQWRLVDDDAGGEDTASITLWSGDYLASIVLDASGRIRSGQIQARGHRADHGCGSATGSDHRRRPPAPRRNKGLRERRLG
jgi:hypothetical protein